MEEQEAVENGGEDLNNDTFSPEEQDKIRKLAEKMYSNGAFLGKDSEGAAKDAKNKLELMGCDISRAENLGEGISPSNYADIVIGRGKPKSTGEFTNQEGNVEKTEKEESLVISKDLTDKSPTEIQTANSIIRIVQKDGSESGLVAQVFKKSDLTGGADTEAEELEIQSGSNLIVRPNEGRIVINLRGVSENSATIEVSQSATSLKTLNSPEK